MMEHSTARPPWADRAYATVVLPALVILAAIGMTHGARAAGPLQSGNTATFTTTAGEIDTIVTTPATDRIDTYSTEVRARLGSGAFLYDQTFAVAFADVQVQAALVQAHDILAGAGAVSFTGPTQVSSTQALVSSATSTITTSTQTTQTIVGTSSWLGPFNLTVGDRGVCGSYALDVNNHATFSSCSLAGTPFTVNAGTTNFDTSTVSLVRIDQTATTTNTFLTTELYELDGAVAGVPDTPAPPSLVLALAAAVAGLWLVILRRRGREWPSPPPGG
jgi:hypothetical protein